MHYSLLLLILACCWLSCEVKEDTISFDPDRPIFFSKDTVAFDTLLSGKLSSTRRLTVYNPGKDAILFSKISLASGTSSDYRVVINGREQNALTDELLRGGDSLLVLVSVLVDEQNKDLPYLVKDSLLFEWNTNRADIKLVSYGQDANLINKAILCDQTWTADRPYLLKDSVIVEAGCLLTIEKGANIYFENDAALFVQGSLQAEADSANRITFTNARFDGVYDRVPGQWNGIYFLEGSANNIISFADIFNGQVGLRVGTPDDDDLPDVVVKNTTIYNMTQGGILAFNSDVHTENTLIYNCGNYLMGAFAGGNYSLIHCTLSNDPPLFAKDDPSVQFTDNLILNNGETLTADLSISLINTIIWGPGQQELLINEGGGSLVAADLRNNIIRTGEDIPQNFTSQERNFPGFLSASTNDYTLDTLAFAQGKALPSFAQKDLTGQQRDTQPDIGAFERIE